MRQERRDSDLISPARSARLQPNAFDECKRSAKDPEVIEYLCNRRKYGIHERADRK